MSFKLLNGDCLELMKSIPDNSIDLIFTDLPYGQTSCKWDCPIDLDLMWKEYLRIKKLNTPIFFTTTTKFGVNLINSAPKRCYFRYDLVWVKSACAGFLSAKKMPLRKHELIYVFYEKLPLYDLSSHKHKFIEEVPTKKTIKEGNTYKGIYTELPQTGKGKDAHSAQYDPPLPTSVVKESTSTLYNNKGKSTTPITKHSVVGGSTGQPRYDPPLPTSVVKEPEPEHEEGQMTKDFTPHKNGNIYDCPDNQEFAGRNGASRYNPPLPTSVVKEDVYDAKERFKNGKLTKHPRHLQNGDDPIYDPPLPNSILEVKSQRTKHSTQKPVDLMKWVFKYYSKEGDLILDNCMGSGSTGVAAIEMNRDFIGMELDKDIFKVAEGRINEASKKV
jgi:hypothetical protein